MSIRQNELERLAVRDYECPRCRAQAKFRCVRLNGRSFVKMQFIQHPHKERVLLVPPVLDVGA